MEQFQAVEYACNWNLRKIGEHKTILRNNDQNLMTTIKSLNQKAERTPSRRKEKTRKAHNGTLNTNF